MLRFLVAGRECWRAKRPRCLQPWSLPVPKALDGPLEPRNVVAHCSRKEVTLINSSANNVALTLVSIT